MPLTTLYYTLYLTVQKYWLIVFPQSSCFQLNMIFVSFISIYYTIIIFCVFHACINCTCSIYLQWENWAERSVPSLGTRHCSLGVSSPSQRILWFSFLKLDVDPEPLRLDYLQKECCWHFQCCHRVQMVHVWRQMHLQRQGWGQNCWQKLMPVASLRNKDCVEEDDLVPRDNDAADAEARWATTVVSQRNLDSRRRPWSRRVDALLCLEHHLGVSTAQLLHNSWTSLAHVQLVVQCTNVAAELHIQCKSLVHIETFHYKTLDLKLMSIVQWCQALECWTLFHSKVTLDTAPALWIWCNNIWIQKHNIARHCSPY